MSNAAAIGNGPGMEAFLTPHLLAREAGFCNHQLAWIAPGTIKTPIRLMDYRMRDYSIEKLQSSGPYISDPELRELGREVARRIHRREPAYQYPGGRRQALAEVFRGDHAEEVYEALQGFCDLPCSPKQSSESSTAQSRQKEVEDQTLRDELNRICALVRYKADQEDYVYSDGLDWLREQGFPDLYPEKYKKLQEAVKQAGERKHLAIITKWLGYVRESAERGAIYERGVRHLRELVIESYPDKAKELRDLLEYARTRAQELKVGTRRQGKRKKRIVVPYSKRPPLKEPVVLYGQPVVILNFGRTFPLSQKDVENHGDHLESHVGELGCYAYYRKPTREEWPTAHESTHETTKLSAHED